MEDYVIGVDLGTGSTKAIAMTRSGEVRYSAQAAYPTLQPGPGYQEQDPEAIWQAFIECLKGATTNGGGRLAGIALSSAMHSIIPVDARGRALMNMMTWADNRSAAIALEVHRSPAGQLLYEKTGTPIHAMSPLCKIMWLRQNDPDLFRRTARFISIKEYIWFKLFGVYEVDYSIASATGLFDIHNLMWNDLSLDTTGIENARLSAPVNAGHRRTCSDEPLCRQMGVDADTPFFIGASDGCLANVGSFATAEGSMAITIGTSGAVRVVRKTPMLNFKAMPFNYRLDAETFVCGGPTNNGGVVLKWYAENILKQKLETARDYSALLEALHTSPPGARGLLFLPYVFGERAPVWDSDACGVFFGLRAHQAQADMTRAVIEGISLALYDITQGMIDAGLDIREIYVSGGFVHSESWLQTMCNIFGKKISLVSTADASATGAAFLALKSLGLIKQYADLQPSATRVFNPDPGHMAAYRKSFLKYRALYEGLSALMEK